MPRSAQVGALDLLCGSAPPPTGHPQGEGLGWGGWWRGDRRRGGRGCFHPARCGWPALSRPREEDGGGTQGSLCRLPRRRLPGHREGAVPAGGPEPCRPLPAPPAALSPSADHEAGPAARGPSRDSQRRNRMSGRTRPSLSAGSGGGSRGKVQPPPLGTWTPTERMSSSPPPPPRGMRRGARPQTPALGPGPSQGGLAAQGCLTQQARVRGERAGCGRVEGEVWAGGRAAWCPDKGPGDSAQHEEEQPETRAV